jgi:diaminopimelate epimerase
MRWRVRFSKWHALGNSYLLVERADGGPLTPERARRLCNVSVGIGADGVLEVVISNDSRAEVIIWNPDGSVAEMSGNGTRIAAAWLARRANASEVIVAVGSREIQARILGEATIETDIGPVEVGDLDTIQLDEGSVEVTAASLGNPHAVVFSEHLTREALLRLGPLLETHPRFPERTNVQLARVDGRHDVRALVWERGAGETQASGSSAVAVAAVAIARGFCDSPVRVHLPGGDLAVQIEDGCATLVGPAEKICCGETDL